MEIRIDTLSQAVEINGIKYVPKYTNLKASETVTIKEVRPIYGDGFSWLQLGFDMPLMKFSPGEKIRIIKI